MLRLASFCALIVDVVASGFLRPTHCRASRDHTHSHIQERRSQSNIRVREKKPPRVQTPRVENTQSLLLGFQGRSDRAMPAPASASRLKWSFLAREAELPAGRKKEKRSLPCLTRRVSCTMKKSSRNPCPPSKIRDCSFQCQRVGTQCHVETATITHNRFHTIDGILGHVLGNTLCSSLFRGGLTCNLVVALTVIYSVLQRGTDNRDSDVKHTRLSQRHQQFCSTL